MDHPIRTVDGPSAAQPDARERRWWHRTWALAMAFAFGIAIGAAVVLAALFDIGPFSGTAAAYVLGYLLAAGAHGLVFSLLVVNPVLQRRPEMMHGRVLQAHRRLPWFRHVGAGLLLGLVLLVAVVTGDVWVSRAGLGRMTTVLFFVAAAIGVLLVVVPLPRREAAVRTGLAANLFAGIDGLIAGAVAVVALVVFSAIYRQANLPDSTIAIPPVHDVRGTYVSLGDSYSSGEGLRPFSTTRPFCHRSLDSGYSVRLLAAFHPTPRTDFVACSGAVTADIFGGGRQQVDGRVHPGVGLVTITIGGNDVGFGEAVLDCFKSACLDAPFRALASDHAMPAPQPLRTWAPKALVVLAGRLDALYTRLRTDYPAARIVVLGYPHLFPRGPATWVPNDCASVLRRVSRSEREWIDNRTDDLNNLIYAEAVQHGLEFVSPADAWQGHEPCGTRGEYTNAVKPVLNYANPIDGGTFHPTVAGQHQFAALVAGYLAAHPTRPDQFSPGRHGPLRIGTDWCPSHLGLVPPPGQRVESCPADDRTR